MSDVTQILTAIEAGDAQAVSSLLPVVYQELRSLAAIHMSRENPGHTLNATALVHEAYLRLVKPRDGGDGPQFTSRKHFFLAASDSMRRILIDHARSKKRQKRGGGGHRVPLHDPAVLLANPADLLVVDELLDKLSETYPRRAELVKLRIFAGCTIAECGDLLGISASTAEDDWTYARAWLKREWNRSEKVEERDGDGEGE